MLIVIHHNPNCGTSRNVLAAIREAGHEPTVIEYLDEGWTRPQLLGLFAAAGLTSGEAARRTNIPDEAQAALEAATTDDDLIAAMVAHPIL
ncbi:MAG: arsenate reductase (glutaredoxin), partial [Pseudomonadota bacterium]